MNMQFDETKMEISDLENLRINCSFIVPNLTLSFLLSEAKRKANEIDAVPYIFYNKKHDNQNKYFSKS